MTLNNGTWHNVKAFAFSKVAAGALTFARIANRPENQIRLVSRLSLAVDLMVEETAEMWVPLLATMSCFCRNHHLQVPVG
jgi:hypothetical protein